MGYHWFTRKCDGMCDICDCPPVWRNSSPIKRGRPYDGAVVDAETDELIIPTTHTESDKE